MTRTMVDACDPDHLPSGHDLTASYVDGGCASAAPTPVRISSLATDAGNVGDCEPGNPGWSTWVQWVLRRRSAGVDPTIYCMDDGYGADSTWAGWRHADGVQAFQLAGVAEPHWWVCHPGAPAVPSYAVAVQVQLGVAPGYDLSDVADHWPGIDPGPTTEELQMPFLMSTPGQPVVLVDGALAVPLTALPTGSGVPPAWAFSAADYQAVLAAARALVPASPPAGGSGPVTGQVSGTLTVTPEGG